MSAQQQQAHAELVELLHHLDHHLEGVEAIQAHPEKWSDGDKLRSQARLQLKAQHDLYHAHRPHFPIDLTIPRDLMRIAARLDVLDELEYAEAKERGEQG